MGCESSAFRRGGFITAREHAQDTARRMLERMRRELSAVSDVEVEPVLVGRTMTMVLKPKKSQGVAQK